MESVFQAIHTLMPLFHILLILSLLLKIILMRGFRAFDVPYLFLSYFRFYTDSEKQMSRNAWRKWYVNANSYINFYAYLWVLICVINLFFYGSIL